MPTLTDPTIVIKAFPTPKQQIVSGLIGLAFTGVVIGTGLVVLSVMDKVETAKMVRKAKKDAENQTVAE